MSMNKSIVVRAAHPAAPAEVVTGTESGTLGTEVRSRKPKIQDTSTRVKTAVFSGIRGSAAIVALAFVWELAQGFL